MENRYGKSMKPVRFLSGKRISNSLNHVLIVMTEVHNYVSEKLDVLPQPNVPDCKRSPIGINGNAATHSSTEC